MASHSLGWQRLKGSPGGRLGGPVLSPLAAKLLDFSEQRGYWG